MEVSSVILPFSLDRPLGLELEDLVVQDLVPGSQAEELGVSIGSRIAAIDGVQPPPAARRAGAGGAWVVRAVELAREQGAQVRLTLVCVAAAAAAAAAAAVETVRDAVLPGAASVPAADVVTATGA